MRNKRYIGRRKIERIKMIVLCVIFLALFIPAAVNGYMKDGPLIAQTSEDVCVTTSDDAISGWEPVPTGGPLSSPRGIEVVEKEQAVGEMIRTENLTNLSVQEEVYIPDQVSRYDAIIDQLTPEVMELLADITAIESRGEPLEGQVAVVEVIFNRCLSPDFPDTIEGVIYDTQYCVQFTSIYSLGQVSAVDMQYEAIEQALYGPNVFDTNVVYFSTSGENDNVAGVIGGHTFCYPYGWEG